MPEQSFDYWCAKFLAAGYKVGKVEQAETAIGYVDLPENKHDQQQLTRWNERRRMEMRTKANAGKAKNKADSIVRRELATVLTNGTVVDEAFLSGDEACHCVAIKVLCSGRFRRDSMKLIRRRFPCRKRKPSLAIRRMESVS